VAVLNPGGKKSGTGTDFSVSDIVDEETNQLLLLVKEEGDFGKRKQEILKALVRIYSSQSSILLITVPNSPLNAMV
jgi:hypothetical protein